MQIDLGGAFIKAVRGLTDTVQYTPERVTGIDPFERGDLRIEKPTAAIYSLKAEIPLLGKTSDMKLLVRGGEFTPMRFFSGRPPEYPEFMSLTSVPLGSLPKKQAQTALYHFEKGVPLARIFPDLTEPTTIFNRVTEGEQTHGVLKPKASLRHPLAAHAGLLDLGYKG